MTALPHTMPCRLAGGEECKAADEWTALTTGQRITMLEYLQEVQAENKDTDKLTHSVDALGRMDELYVSTGDRVVV